jgi:hypothetical protein
LGDHLAKDRLSALADPARGLTIAYTTLFVAAEARRTFMTAAWRRLLNGANRPTRVVTTPASTSRREHFPGSGRTPASSAFGATCWPG